MKLHAASHDRLPPLPAPSHPHVTEQRLILILPYPHSTVEIVAKRLPLQKTRRRQPALAGTVCALALFLSSTLQAAPGPATTQPSRLPNPEKIPLTGPVHFQARNVVFHIMAGVHLSVASVDALLLPARAGQPVTLDQPTSMRVKMLSGDTSISAEDMTNLLNNYALPQSKLPIRDVEVSFAENDVQMTGKIHKLLDLPFSASATLGVTPRGNLQLHFYKITAAGILHKKLLDFFGLSVADIARLGDARSFHVRGDDVDFPINVLFPAPPINGQLTSVSIHGNRLVQVFGVVKPFAPAPVPAEHYIYFRGGLMSFERLSMQGVDLEMLNKDADREFEFSLENIFLQVLPGYLKPQADHGLVGYIESYHDPKEASEGTKAAAAKPLDIISENRSIAKK